MSEMNGTTRCPHCDTRFRITEAQLAAHHGRVRCGHCLQAFEAYPDFIPDQPAPQLELPIDTFVEHTEEIITQQSTVPSVHAAPELHEYSISIEIPAETPDESEHTAPPSSSLDEADFLSLSEPDDTLDFRQATLTKTEDHTKTEESTALEVTEKTEAAAEPEVAAETAHTAFSEAIHAEEQYDAAHAQPAEQATQGIFSEAVPKKRRSWLWASTSLIAALLLTGQSAYFFRTDLAAHWPAVKPGLTELCQLFGCSVPLPQRTALMSIESSSLDADPAHENQVTLTALLRNRASYAMAFPTLALTLNDSDDKPLARRLLLPAEYLPAEENEKTGFTSNHEVNLKLPLYTGELRPVGYRLELFYRQK